MIIQAVLRAASIDVNSFHHHTRQSALHVAALHCRPDAVDTLGVIAAEKQREQREFLPAQPD